TYIFSFISFHAKKYRVTSACGGEGAVLAVHQDGQREAKESLRSATVLIQLAAEPSQSWDGRAPIPPSFSGNWGLRELLLTLFPP
ncbi:mCG1036324, partial [Mus musculus]